MDGENAALFETTLRLQRLALYTRYEWTQKSVEELDLNSVTYGDHSVFPVNALTLGLNYDLFSIGKFHIAGGGQLTGYHADSRLNSYSYEKCIKTFSNLSLYNFICLLQ